MSSPSLPPQAERSKFPGMRPREAAVMRRWLGEFESAYDNFEYNVRIGPSRDVGPSFPRYVRKTAMMSSQLRLDAIAWNGQQATLVELKQKAWALGVQQLALYGAVWAAENPQLPKSPANFLSVPGVSKTSASLQVSGSPGCENR